MNEKGLSSPIVLKGKDMNVSGDSYVKTILPKLVQFSYNTIGAKHIFMHDRAPPHRSNVAKNWLANCSMVGETLTEAWPPQDADLNPIENIWSYVNNLVELKKGQNCRWVGTSG